MMKRSWQIWFGFAAALAVVLAALGWISVTALRLDEAETHMRHQAALEEDVRLALWRMDAQLWSVVSQETARPYFAYSVMYSADRANAWRFDPRENKVAPAPSDVLIPSPLLTQTPPHRKLYFQYQFPANGEPVASPHYTSPQVPGQPWQAQLDPSLLNPAKLAADEDRLSQFRRLVAPETIAAALPPEINPQAPWETSHPVPDPLAANPPADSQRPAASDPFHAPHPPAAARREIPPQTRETGPQTAPQQVAPPPTQPGSQPAFAQQQPVAPPANPPQAQGQVPGNPQVALANRARKSPEQQLELSINEYNTRFQGYQQQLNFENAQNYSSLVPTADDVKTGVMHPVWIGQELLLARWVEVGTIRYLQGVWLNWTSLQQELLSTVTDLFPAASLKPVSLPNRERPERLLSVVPVEFTPGAIPQLEPEGWSPVRTSLLLAWACVLLAALAVAALLSGVMRLSERRASFVSAVTHELRTPLTTFRMYADMLAEGMVPDESRQKKYLGTLRTEADRLGHLVENVLAYARLERGRQRRTPQRASVEELVAQWQPRLADRAARDEMQLQTQLNPAAAGQTLQTDASAVEQILFNLVDNACKYAAGSPRHIHLEVDSAGAFLELRVRDHGPGIARREAKRLFRPFHKSAHDAAHSAPGVGLGLALSRRLARELGGDLCYQPGCASGALFVLTLPLA